MFLSIPLESNVRECVARDPRFPEFTITLIFIERFLNTSFITIFEVPVFSVSYPACRFA